MKHVIQALIIITSTALSISNAAPIAVSGTAEIYFDYGIAGSIAGKLYFSGSDGINSFWVGTNAGCTTIGPFGGGYRFCSWTYGSLNGVNSFNMDSGISYSLGNGGGSVSFGSITLPLQSYFTFTGRFYYDATPGRLSYRDDYVISSTAPTESVLEQVPEPASVSMAILSAVALFALRLKARAPQRCSIRGNG